ncbi:MAG: NlpC/P60 family protein, partial [Myxococcota bacterium]
HSMSLEQLKWAFNKYDHAPYRYGSVGPDRFDCSGLVWRIFGEHGVDLPRTTRTQLRSGSLVISGRNYLLKNRR